MFRFDRRRVECIAIRAIIAILIGLLAWGVVATALDMALRITLPGYAAAEPQLHFTVGMMLARLALPGAVPSIAAGFVTCLIGRGSRLVVATLAIILLLMFVPTHYRLWTTFPVWFHLTFLSSLLVMPWLGARLERLLKASRRRQAAAAAVAALIQR